MRINLDRIAYVIWPVVHEGGKGRDADIHVAGTAHPLRPETLSDKAADDLERALRDQRGEQV